MVFYNDQLFDIKNIESMCTTGKIIVISRPITIEIIFNPKINDTESITGILKPIEDSIPINTPIEDEIAIVLILLDLKVRWNIFLNSVLIIQVLPPNMGHIACPVFFIYFSNIVFLYYNI